MTEETPHSITHKTLIEIVLIQNDFLQSGPHVSKPLTDRQNHCIHWIYNFCSHTKNYSDGEITTALNAYLAALTDPSLQNK